MMKMKTFALRCSKEILRDPINLFFGLDLFVNILVVHRRKQHELALTSISENLISELIPNCFKLDFVVLGRS